jgi:hypothetical protein
VLYFLKATSRKIVTNMSAKVNPIKSALDETVKVTFLLVPVSAIEVDSSVATF